MVVHYIVNPEVFDKKLNICVLMESSLQHKCVWHFVMFQIFVEAVRWSMRDLLGPLQRAGFEHELLATTAGLHFYVSGQGQNIDKIFFELTQRMFSFKLDMDRIMASVAILEGQLRISNEVTPIKIASDCLKHVLCEQKWERGEQLAAIHDAMQDRSLMAQNLQDFSRSFQNR